MLEDLTFHHIGYACRDLDAEAKQLAPLGYRPEGPDFVDPRQKVQGRFLSGGGPRLELLVPEGDSTTLDPWLKSGIKMYHLGYEAPDLSACIEQLVRARARLIVQPTPAVAFGGRPIAFLMLPKMLMIELIQKGEG